MRTAQAHYSRPRSRCTCLKCGPKWISAGGAYSTPQTPSCIYRGLLLREGERERGGKGAGEREGRGREGKRREGRKEGNPCVSLNFP